MHDQVKKFKLEVHKTKDIHDQHENGSLTVVWRDWDDIVEHPIKMIYVSSVNPGEIKGPHIHTKRNSYFVCTRGKIIFIIEENPGVFIEIESSEENPVMVLIPKNVPSAHINISSNSSSVLALADIAWKPNDDEMKNISYENYNWEKWKNSS